MSAPFCAKCGAPMQHHPPGVNKAGKPFNASWRCPKKCDGSIQWIKDDPGQAAAPASAAATPAADPTVRYENLPMEAWMTKQRLICAQSAVNAAVEFMATKPDSGTADVVAFADELFRSFVGVQNGAHTLLDQDVNF